MQISVIHDGELWDRAVTLVKQRYLDRHAAAVEPTPQYFVVVQDKVGRLLACAGLTFADTGPLFSECYLDLPVEQVARARLGVGYRREQIVEVGNLVACDPIAARLVVRMVPILAGSLGARLLFCTVTDRVRGLLNACRLPFVPVCAAAAERVGDPARWGRYYERAPQTGFIDLDGVVPDRRDSPRRERQAV
ncbi:thermostable hemolysin [Chitinimonas lacunae]|uniref:Thermostable hemolysin n=1 Tax=Chitinimonas lacunae TaxID=1963018 RepID=A0ABV8MWM9_9NEIS